MDHRQDRAATPGRGQHAAHALDRDWLGQPEAGLAAALRNAVAQARDAATPPAEVPRLHALLALLPQVSAARALVRGGRLEPATARAAMRSDFAMGYLFGLSAAGGDPVAAPIGARRRRETLIRLHAALFGAGPALDLARRWTVGAHIVVGAPFGDGLLAAEADLAALAMRLARGADPEGKGGLLGWLLRAAPPARGPARTMH